MEDLSILRSRDRREMSWKNGGGVTSEVIVVPTGADFDTFDWRISIATIHTSGPFSPLPGVDRQLVILEGLLTLKVGDHLPSELSPASAPLEFPGDTPVAAEVVAGPVTDLNVMTRRGRFRATIEARTLSTPATIFNTEVSTVLIATELVDVEYEGVEHKLQARDAVLLRGASGARLACRAAPAIVYVIEISDAHSAG